ncbi:MAG: transcription termination/antitermination protein NusG [Rhizomicrobium sp.]
MTAKGWVVLQAVSPGYVLTVEGEAMDYGFPVYVARRWWGERVGDKKSSRIELRSEIRFGSYVFLHLDNPDEVSVANRLRGVRHPGILSDASGNPRTVQPGVIQALRRLEVAEQQDARASRRQQQKLPPGTSVRFLRGPFEGQMGTLLVAARGMVHVLTDFASVTAADCDVTIVAGDQRRATA